MKLSFDRKVGRAIQLPLAVMTVLLAVETATQGQQQYNGYQRSVGGISIKADGLLDNAGVDVLGKLAQMRSEKLQPIAAPLHAAAPMRKLSLKALDAAVAEAARSGKPLADEYVYLGGLQQIRYVFAYPEEHDIVLVGPAEGWKADRRGNIVGATTGRPVMLLDDLLVALRTAAASAQAGITCSIDPTPEGMQQLRSHAGKLRTIGNPHATAAGIEQALGRQQVTFSGVPATSHFAAVLVAADYRMKRVAMGFEASPVKGLPSFLQMMTVSGQGMSNIMQRWWLEPRYEGVLRDPAGLAWELAGAGVRCQTEEEFLAAGGKRERSNQANPTAQKWADLMTEHYAALAVAEPVFGELRNCMELAIVGALISREGLRDKAGCSLPTLMNDEACPAMQLTAPKQVDSKVSMLKRGRNWVISASGGVAVYPQNVLQNVRMGDAPAAARAKAQPAAGKWCWN